MSLGKVAQVSFAATDRPLNAGERGADAIDKLFDRTLLHALWLVQNSSNAIC